jgi:hypothetical protein
MTNRILNAVAFLRPTKAAAAIAGAWAGAGTVLMLAWAAQPGSALHGSWAGALIGPTVGLALLIPGYFCMVGRPPEAIPWSALRERAGRQRLLHVLARVGAWSASAACAAALGRYAIHALGLPQLALA